MAAAGVRCLHRTKRGQRTAKSCGPGAATLASIPAGLCWRGNGDKKGRSPGRARISRQTIARGRPGCPGCTCQIRVRSFYPLHTVLRAPPAPGLPCALCSRGSNEMARLRRKSRRENEGACLSHYCAPHPPVLILRRRAAPSRRMATGNNGAFMVRDARSLSSGRALRGPVGAPHHEELPFTAEETS
jgi:hypothetical protein